MTISVLIADDQALIRAGFAALIASEDDMSVIGEAQHGEAAVALARKHHPDVVLMDIRMPGTDGLSATQLITRDPDLAAVRVLVLTTFESDDYVLAALRAGASGFLGKGVEPGDLLDAVRVVAAGESLLSPKATRAVIERVLAAPEASVATTHASALDALTDREREVAQLVAQGFSNEEIARALFLSPLTVKTHVNRAMAKCNVRDRAQLVVLAYQVGLVRVGTDPA